MVGPLQGSQVIATTLQGRFQVFKSIVGLDSNTPKVQHFMVKNRRLKLLSLQWSLPSPQDQLILNYAFKANFILEVKWFVVRYGSKDGHQKDKYLKEIRTRKRIFNFNNKQDIRTSSKIYDSDKWPWTIFRFANHPTLIACFIFYEKWVQPAKRLQTTHTSTLLQKPLVTSITLFKSIIVICGTDNIPCSFPGYFPHSV